MKYFYSAILPLLVSSLLSAPNFSFAEQEGATKAALHPGILAYRDGSWLWSDHLFNLPNNIDVVVELTKPSGLDLPITNDDLKNIVTKNFEAVGITPYANLVPGKPNLPSFHVLIMVYPIRDGYTFTVIGRLFEGVNLERVKLDQRVTMQAVTWDRTSIHVVSTGKLKDELEESVGEVSKEFADRYSFFENLRLKSQ
ncbi:MAG: hypothetical protein VX777_03540 [Chlamydiota bacterium]|nr:hypothetical protein [Chlamydiota bacterium]